MQLTWTRGFQVDGAYMFIAFSTDALIPDVEMYVRNEAIEWRPWASTGVGTVLPRGTSVDDAKKLIEAVLRLEGKL